MANTPVGECIEAFMRRDYEKCATQSTRLLGAALDNGSPLDFDAVLLNVISLERLGQGEKAFEHAVAFYERLPDSWQQLLMFLAIGRGNPDDVLPHIGEKRDDEAAKKMWQLNFCFGAQLVSRHLWGEARKLLQGMVMGGVPVISCTEMALTVVEYNYICHGSALCDFDKPIVDLNVKCSQATGSEALALARRAYEQAQQALGTQHPAYLTAVHNVGAAHMNLGQFAEAEPYLTKTVALRRAACGEHDEQVAHVLNILGALYARLGDKGRSAECYAQALDITEKSKAG